MLRPADEIACLALSFLFLEQPGQRSVGVEWPDRAAALFMEERAFRLSAALLSNLVRTIRQLQRDGTPGLRGESDS